MRPSQLRAVVVDDALDASARAADDHDRAARQPHRRDAGVIERRLAGQRVPGGLAVRAGDAIRLVDRGPAASGRLLRVSPGSKIVVAGIEDALRAMGIVKPRDLDRRSRSSAGTEYGWNAPAGTGSTALGTREPARPGSETRARAVLITDPTTNHLGRTIGRERYAAGPRCAQPRPPGGGPRDQRMTTIVLARTALDDADAVVATMPRSGCGCPLHLRPAASPRRAGPSPIEKPGSADSPGRRAVGALEADVGLIHAIQRQPTDRRVRRLGDPDRDPFAGSRPSECRNRRPRSSATTPGCLRSGRVARTVVCPASELETRRVPASMSPSASERASEPSHAIAKRPVGSTTGRHRSPASASARVAGSISDADRASRHRTRARSAGWR